MTKEPRAQIAREKGAKSKGPKTRVGRRRVRAAAFAQWRPRNPFEGQYVDGIAGCSWRTARLRLCATHEVNVSIPRLRQAAEHPVNALILNRTMVTAELRALRGVPVLGTSQ